MPDPNRLERIDCATELHCLQTASWSLKLLFHPLQPLPVGHDVIDIVRLDRSVVGLGVPHQEHFPNFRPPAVTRFSGVKSINVTVHFHASGHADAEQRQEASPLLLQRTIHSHQDGAGQLFAELVEALAVAAHVPTTRICRLTSMRMWRSLRERDEVQRAPQGERE